MTRNLWTYLSLDLVSLRVFVAAAEENNSAPAAEREPRVSFAELLDEPFIAMQQGSALLALYREHAKLLGHPLRERAHAASFESVRRLVGVGLGVSILPASAAARPEHGAFIVRPLDEPWSSRSLLICTRDPSRLAGAAKLMVDHLTAERRDHE